MYTVKRYEAVISTEEYLEKFVDVETFLQACKACPNYDRIWSCPSYDFDVINYWKKYKTLRLIASKIEFEKDMLERTYEPTELVSILDHVLPVEKQKLTDELLAMEKDVPGSMSLSAGSCSRCKGGCTRPEGKPCRFPDTMRYSIESLGGNVGLTIEKLMGIRLEWMEDGRLPHHFVLVCGLLLPE